MEREFLQLVRVMAVDASFLVPIGAKAYEIVEPISPRVVDKTAVNELKVYLDRLAAGGCITVDGHSHAVFHVGDTAFACEQGIEVQKLAEEQWLIRSFGGAVVLAGGGERGALYAVYHFLEDFCGVRWWSEAEEDVPTGGAGVAAPGCLRQACVSIP